MDTGRISLPSIDTMLNTTGQGSMGLPPSTTTTTDESIIKFTSHDINYRGLSQKAPSLPYRQYPLTAPHASSFTELPSSSSSSSSSSSLSSSSLPSWSWRGHTRSLSLDSNQVISSSPLSGLSPPIISSVRPSHRGSPTRSTVGSPLLSSSSQPPTLSPSQQPLPAEATHEHHSAFHQSYQQHQNPLQQQQQQQQHPRYHHLYQSQRQQHHRRTVSTSYINTSVSSSNTLNDKQHQSSTAYNDTPQRKYLCHECSKSFSRPSSLRTHIFSHTGEKPFACPHRDCDRTFSVQSNMRRHIRVHYSASLAQNKPHH